MAEERNKKSHYTIGPKTCNIDSSNELPPGTKRERKSTPKSMSSDQDFNGNDEEEGGNLSGKPHKRKTASPQHSTNTEDFSKYNTDAGFFVGWHRDDLGTNGLQIEAVMDVTGLEVTFLVAMKPNMLPAGHRERIHRHLLEQITGNEQGMVDPEYVMLDPELFSQHRPEYLEKLDEEEKKELVLAFFRERNDDVSSTA